MSQIVFTIYPYYWIEQMHGSVCENTQCNDELLELSVLVPYLYIVNEFLSGFSQTYGAQLTHHRAVTGRCPCRRSSQDVSTLDSSYKKPSLLTTCTRTSVPGNVLNLSKGSKSECLILTIG